MVYLRKGHLLTRTSGKMRNKKYGPCKFEYFLPEDFGSNSGMSCFQEGETNVG
jgi:hypothetical protein